MGEIKVFISYRRDGAGIYPKFLQKSLIEKGFDVFLDTESMRTGPFDTQIYTRIDESSSVLLLLPPNALDRCKNDGDWVRTEIAYALKKGKNIIPLMMDGFAGFPDNLPEDITDVRRYNGKRLNPGNWDEVMNWLDEAIRETAGKQIVDVMCPHCGAVSQQDENGRLAVECDECGKDFMLKIGKQVFENRGFVIEGDVLEKYVGHETALRIPSREMPFTMSLRTIGERAFANNETLESIDLTYITDDDDMYGIRKINKFAFDHCCALQTVTLPEIISRIEEHAFSFCTRLKHMEMPRMVLDMNGMLPEALFSCCSSLESVVLPSGVEQIGSHAFYGCESLKMVSHWICEPVFTEKSGKFDIDRTLYESHIEEGLPKTLRRIMNVAFMNCVSLELPVFPHEVELLYRAFEHTKYHTEQSCFEGKIDAQGLAVSGANLQTATDRSIETIIVPEGIEEIEEYAFFGCARLTEIRLPESLKRIGYKAFGGCTKLTSVELPHNTIYLGPGAFVGCTALTDVKGLNPEGYSEYYDSETRSVSPECIVRFAFFDTPFAEQYLK